MSLTFLEYLQLMQYDFFTQEWLDNGLTVKELAATLHQMYTDHNAIAESANRQMAIDVCWFPNK